jgi:hypothetical protein
VKTQNEQEKDTKIMKLKAQVKLLKKQNRHYYDAWWGIDKQYDTMKKKNLRLVEKLKELKYNNEILISRNSNYYNNYVLPLRDENKELKAKIAELEKTIKDTENYRQEEGIFRKHHLELQDKLEMINKSLSEYFEEDYH